MCSLSKFASYFKPNHDAERQKIVVFNGAIVPRGSFFIKKQDKSLAPESLQRTWAI